LLYADNRWMLAVSPQGLIGLRALVQIEIEFAASLSEKRQLLDELAAGADAEAVAEIVGTDPAEAGRMLERLREAGALAATPPPPPPSDGTPLIEALVLFYERGQLPHLVWTADEALVVPSGLDESQRRQLLRAFIAGIEPRARRVAYGHAASWRADSVRGDAPDPEPLRHALLDSGLDRSAITVLGLNGSSHSYLDPSEIGRVGVDRTHRLGPVTSTSQAQLQDGASPLHLVSVRIATPNLAHPEPPVLGFSGKGTAPTAVEAEMIARGEAAERYAMGDISGRRIVRAAEEELAGALPGDRLFRHNSRQYEEGATRRPYDPQERYLWTSAAGPDGDERWVLAEAVFNPFRDFERSHSVARSTSSGAAAHRTLSEAVRRGFCELVERDAFMWTWVQRLSRERIGVGSLPSPLQARAAELRRIGYEVDFINLTLETEPVILCVVHGDALLVVGACCDRDAARAASKSLDEATVVLSLAIRSEPVEPSDVRTPYDHVRLYRDQAVVEQARFLHSASFEIELGEVRGGDPSLDSMLTGIGEPLTVDLSSRTTAPLRVARCLVGGLIPITFGWDQEPLGMPLLASSRSTADGRRLGSRLDLTTAGPLMPHPFA
jgi:ribosomal protein S12 methylthiotransferase accessory factor